MSPDVEHPGDKISFAKSLIGSLVVTLSFLYHIPWMWVNEPSGMQFPLQAPVLGYPTSPLLHCLTETTLYNSVEHGSTVKLTHNTFRSL